MKIVLLIVIDSYIIIKSKDNNKDDENNAQNNNNNNNNKKLSKIKKQKTNTIPTNKTLGTDKTLTGEQRKKTYLLYLNYEKATLSNMQCKRHVH